MNRRAYRRRDVTTMSIRNIVSRPEQESEKERGSKLKKGEERRREARKARLPVVAGGRIGRVALTEGRGGGDRDAAECGQVYWVTGSMRKAREPTLLQERKRASVCYPTGRPVHLHPPTSSSPRCSLFRKSFPPRYVRLSGLWRS